MRLYEQNILSVLSIFSSATATSTWTNAKTKPLPKMKVREIEMILADMGAIDPENPEESLGKNRSLQIYLKSFIL